MLKLQKIFEKRYVKDAICVKNTYKGCFGLKIKREKKKIHKIDDVNKKK